MPQARSLLQPVLHHPAYRAARAAMAEGSPEAALSGLTLSAKALVAAALAHELERPLAVLTSDNETAERLREAAATFLGWLEDGAERAVGTLPALDCSPYEGRSPHAEILERRAVTLWGLARGRMRILFVPLPAALGRFRERAFYSSLALELQLGDELNLDDLVEHLAGVGYETNEPAGNVGEFSVRGGIIDVFPPETPWPFRIEFFGDRIESLREFDPGTQRSLSPVPSASLFPLTETQRSPNFFGRLVQKLIERGPKPRRSEEEPEWATEYSRQFPGWEFYAPLIDPHPNCLFSLYTHPVLVWDESAERKLQLRQALETWTAAFDEVRDVIPTRPRPEEIFLNETEFLKAVEGLPQFDLKELGMDVREELSGPPGFEQHELVRADASLGPAPEEAPPTQGQNPSLPPHFVLHTQPAPKFHSAVKLLAEDLRSRLDSRGTVAFVLPTSGKADRLQEIFAEYQIPFSTMGISTEDKTRLDNASNSNSVTATAPPVQTAGDASGLGPPSGLVWIVRGEIKEGVAFPDLRLLLISDSDLFGGFTWGSRGRRERSGISTFISDLSDLKVGDYVVHVDHGIGLYRGLRQLEADGVRRDFMLLTYQDDAKLYVPLERLDLVEKYRSSGDGAKPQLDRLGGATWERTKSRVKRALRDLAQELLRIYAERKMRGGQATGLDTPWQKEFEQAFEFEETPDQLSALADIKQDLESLEPMDRLLCGDVGYGKTELAMRAAFKVVQDSRQVAVLAPTTVLAFQHYTTFRQRMTPFPIRVEMLSRFRSAAEQKKIRADTEAGQVDILIGTHRLLSKDVRFRDLGILIVDEEQRFGVAAKEKLKKLKAGVDVLTMSATPIPRTLHMSLGGLRDLSVIETPPRGRLAIQTSVAPFSQSLIQAAILQEMERQGQVFFVHNRVESIFTMAALIGRLVPTTRLGVAHGQMRERELEKVMVKFVQGEYDVLVATALIENGLDIPRANTIIVNHADRFGLADLYQLRGRVGRSDRRAYAFFLVPSEDALTPLAKRRLAALKEFSDLGAGFRLAALDLELRGAGNVLGREQHGHLNAIGIDLYLKMLEQTVEELKGAPVEPKVRTTLNLGLDIKIPDRYIGDERQRLRMYKRISSLATAEARADLEAELTDRYGPIPPSVSNLLSYALLKSVAETLRVQSVERKADEIWMRFHEQARVDPQKLTHFLGRHREATFRPDGTLRFRQAEDSNLLAHLENILQELHA